LVNMQNAKSVIRDLQKLGTPRRAKASAWFFKTGKGEYGYRDVFVGVSVPEQRRLAKRYRALPLNAVSELLKNPIHECRQTGLFILVDQYRRADDLTRARLVRFYLANTKRVNNWDLVDCSAPYILGEHLLEHDRSVLYRCARSKNIWERRIAIIATARFIRANQFEDTLKIAEILLEDDHDLIHKAVGWMLREVGNRSRIVEERFLRQHAKAMPRTMLRYAIEKFPEQKRKKYLNQ